MTLLDFRPSQPTAASIAASTTASITASATTAHAPRLRTVPPSADTEARGFVLYVGIDEAKALQSGSDLGEIVRQLKQFTASLAPAAETYAAVAIAPRGAGGRDVDVVRLALQDPAAVAAQREASGAAEGHPEASAAVIIDFTRRQVTLEGKPAALTHTEFELLAYLVRHEGRTTTRGELIRGLWAAGAATQNTETAAGSGTAGTEAEAGGTGDIPNERTVDVHVRRLRSKLGDYQAIVRTIRGAGYRFDKHADVAVPGLPAAATRTA